MTRLPASCTLSHEVAGVVERERDDGGRVLERRGEGVVVESRHDVVHREGTVRQVAKLGELAAELVGRTVPGAEAAERAGVRDRRGERGRREDAHPRLDEREPRCRRGRTAANAWDHLPGEEVPPTYGIAEREVSEPRRRVAGELEAGLRRPSGRHRRSRARRPVGRGAAGSQACGAVTARSPGTASESVAICSARLGRCGRRGWRRGSCSPSPLAFRPPSCSRWWWRQQTPMTLAASVGPPWSSAPCGQGGGSPGRSRAIDIGGGRGR